MQKVKAISIIAVLLSTVCLGSVCGLCGEEPSNAAPEEAMRVVAQLFDGSTLKSIPVDRREMIVSHGITSGLYGVIFYTADGFRPVVTVFQAAADRVGIEAPPLPRIEDPSRGIVIGVVASVVSGGKLKARQGLRQVFGGESVELAKERVSASMTTDLNGVFVFTVPPGEYRLSLSGREAGKVNVEAGRTTVRNLPKGVMLVD